MSCLLLVCSRSLVKTNQFEMKRKREERRKLNKRPGIGNGSIYDQYRDIRIIFGFSFYTLAPGFTTNNPESWFICTRILHNFLMKHHTVIRSVTFNIQPLYF